jgi:hypothetical protein
MITHEWDDNTRITWFDLNELIIHE